MKDKNGNRPARKKYEKPMLRVVSIAPGMQTLGTGCKLVDGSGVSYNQPCVSHACAASPGS
jgi:hypothetical protein